MVAGQAHGGPSALRRRLLAHLRLAGRRPVRRPDLRAPVVRRHDGARQAEGRRRLRDVHAARRAVSTASTTPTCGRKARPSPRTPRNLERDRRLSSPRSRRRPASSCSGARPTCSRTAATWRAPRPIPIRTCSPIAAATVKTCIDVTKRLGGENYVLWGGREGYETLLNTDLEARAATRSGRFLQPGRRLQAQDRLQGHDPDRAEAAGADQAPVRLRRRHGVRLPQALTGSRTR